jgi:hypothetical protein
MSWVRSILQCCGIDSSWAQPGSKAKRDPDALTDFDGEMPSYEEKGEDDKTVSG